MNSYLVSTTMSPTPFLAVLLSLILIACTHDTLRLSENTGRASIALTVVPPDVACVEIDVIDSESSKTSSFLDVTSSSSALFPLSDLPVGLDTFSAKAFPVSCMLVTPASAASWTTPSAVTVAITASTVTTVPLSLEHNGQADVNLDFPADDAGTSFLYNDSSPTTMLAFINAVASHYCANLHGCCVGLGSTAWNETTCENVFGPASTAPHSGIGNLNSTVTYLAGGTITLNPVHAKNCLDILDHYDCGTLTPHFLATRNYECAQALQGTLPLGATCTDSMQCAGDAWCNRFYATGYDTCMPILGIGSPCGTDSVDFACQTHGYGLQTQACDWDVHHATGTQTCQPLLPLGAADGYPNQCQTELATGGVCVASLPGTVLSTCAFFAAP